MQLFMDKKDLTEIIEKGEDSFTEFKEEVVHSDNLAAEIVAFTNQATRSVYYDELPVPATSVDELDILYFR
jgi:predicted HTH transcriptional regulator